MAELPHIGKHCAFSECKRLDYLSIGCSGCSEAFCKDHFAFDNHNCSRKYLNSTGRKEYHGIKSYTCTFQSCNNTELTPVICEFCDCNFCLQHRHQSDHCCPKLEVHAERMQATKEHVQKIVEKQSETKTKGQGRKSKAMAAKVALMKIKLKAVGDKAMPDSERVYISVNLPKGYKNSPKAVYFSKQWTIGRTIDDIAFRAKLDNKNNVATAKKLKLFDIDSGTALIFERTVQELLDAELFFSGSTLTMEYVDPVVECLSESALNQI